jgi:hypothetical protein
VLYDKLWEIAERSDWRLMTVGYKTFAVGAFVIAAVLIWNSIRIWKRMWRIETQLSKMEKKINTLEMQESRRLMTGLNANSKTRIDPRDTAVEMDVGDFSGLTMSPPTTPAQPESAKSAKLRQ